ncbi:MAG: UDP-N-acetylmuramoyl-tripeptide--D-alanyl-D-alanine ligase [Christensenellaceae bacterium]|jgi:UDP-N-acetylmuramoyl-tripeptide--D-alanyl-D-alanine ligase|nr:UDP-N-acetylmuramoyl-tripeptide--D-alanyl-D-alanine ligase [Christensenellaceae bacterium]
MLHFELIISRLISISLLILSNPIVILVNLIIAPFEFLNNTRYIKRAKLKLNKINAIKIGITGSYGKTSCKNILTAMLSTKYKVLKTDKSRNTPMGIYLTTNELTGDEEVFIAEMGARRCGDIKKLCDIVNPQYGIITGIGNQHLGEFGSLGKIIKAKCELIDMMPPNGFMVFNGDDKKTKSLKTRFHGESQTVSINSEEGIYAKNIKLSTNGLSFDIFGFETTISVSTKLLGRHNVLNILMCTVLAHKLGIGLEEIKSAISNLNPTHHRLELLKNTGEITIIDDSYNANIDGSLFALEVLKLFKGRKIVFSQGIIELGIINKRVNQELGMMIAKSADLIILTGPNSSALLKGIDSAGFSGKILKFGDFKETTKALKSILKPGDVLLVQNDIP